VSQLRSLVVFSLSECLTHKNAAAAVQIQFPRTLSHLDKDSYWVSRHTH